VKAARGSAGQTTVELALCLPFVALLVGLLFELAMIATDQGRLAHAAREAARVAVVDHDEAPVLEAARAGGLQDVRIAVSPGPEARVQGRPLEVHLTYKPAGRVPLLGAVFRGLEMEARAVMRIERP
jgi:hypothetical protein